MAEWQDIATAPRDGTEVLGLFLERPVIMKWLNWLTGAPDDNADWLGVNVVWFDGNGTATRLRDGWGNGGPTHWAELPPLPAPASTTPAHQSRAVGADGSGERLEHG